MQGRRTDGVLTRPNELLQPTEDIAMSPDKQRLKDISEQFARGNMDFAEPYLADGITWNILGDGTIIGKEQVLEANKMARLETFPEITIKNIVGEGDFVVVESTGEARTKSGKPYNQAYCEVFRFMGEELQEITTYLDTALSAEALG
jgi:ketosteroid isomerase-like protein